jgi:hypothetical protein
MKAGIYILSWCLLTAMLLSLFQYVPVSEDEMASANKTELAKKAKEGSEKDNTDEDPDSDNEDEFMNSNGPDVYNYSAKLNAYLSKHSFYSFHVINKFTPPPKIQA